jgi:hypothetical protein
MAGTTQPDIPEFIALPLPIIDRRQDRRTAFWTFLVGLVVVTALFAGLGALVEVLPAGLTLGIIIGLLFGWAFAMEGVAKNKASRRKAQIDDTLEDAAARVQATDFPLLYVLYQAGEHAVTEQTGLCSSRMRRQPYQLFVAHFRWKDQQCRPTLQSPQIFENPHIPAGLGLIRFSEAHYVEVPDQNQARLMFSYSRSGEVSGAIITTQDLVEFNRHLQVLRSEQI